MAVVTEALCTALLPILLARTSWSHACAQEVVQSTSTVRWSHGNKACRECHCLPRAVLTATAACAHCGFMLSLDPIELLVISESNKSKPHL